MQRVTRTKIINDLKETRSDLLKEIQYRDLKIQRLSDIFMIYQKNSNERDTSYHKLFFVLMITHIVCVILLMWSLVSLIECGGGLKTIYYELENMF